MSKVEHAKGGTFLETKSTLNVDVTWTVSNAHQRTRVLQHASYAKWGHTLQVEDKTYRPKLRPQLRSWGKGQSVGLEALTRLQHNGCQYLPVVCYQLTRCLLPVIHKSSSQMTP